MKKVAVIDLFAGPGGLGEGFAQYAGPGIRFDIALSVEKDSVAVRTLRLRKFFRAFRKQDVPEEYYDYLKGKLGNVEELAKLYPAQWSSASADVLEATLGAPDLDRQFLEDRIRQAIKNSDSWILVGGPPCQAYSLAGRSRMRGGNPNQFTRDHRHTLYKEYLRILAKFLPPVFVMENVKGLLSSKLGRRTAFEQIVKDLGDPQNAMSGSTSSRYSILPVVQYGTPDASKEGHVPADFIVQSELHGVPQARHRVILVGVREDLACQVSLRMLKLAKEQVPVGDVISDLPPLRSRLSGEDDSFDIWASVVREAARLCNKELEAESVTTWCKRKPRLDVDPGFGGRFIKTRRKPKALAEWFCDPRLEGVTNHETRSHMRADLARYLFVAAFAEAEGRSPKLNDFPPELLPEHKNVREKADEKAIPFSDRFRVQRVDAPSSTVTSHISKDGHYYIHPDVLQCRALTVREAARLQTFPDNYFFEGNRTQQYHQVGNAVPPYLAWQIAGSVADVLVKASSKACFSLKRNR